MNRRMTMLTLFFLVLGFVFSNAHGNEPMAKTTYDPYEVGKLIGTPVETPKGEYLARVDDFVIDNGRIAFAVLAHGGFLRFGEKYVAVPFGALSYRERGRLFVLDVSKEKLESAPAFDRRTELADRKWAEDIYRYFGQQPYWTESGAGKTMGPTIGQPTMEDKREAESSYGSYP